MAGSDESEQENANNDDTDRFCTSCSKKIVKKKLECVRCLKVFHKSCAERINKFEKLPNLKILCCNKNVGIKWEEKDDKTEEISLLKKLVAEMEDKNNLLAEKVSNLESQLRREYSDVLKELPARGDVTTRDNIPGILIKPKAKQNSKQTKQKLYSEINPVNLKVGIKQVKENRDGSLLVKCEKQSDVQVLSDQINNKMKDNYEIAVDTLKNPRIKIVGIEESHSEEELEQIIKHQNFQNMNSDVRVQYIMNIKKKNTYTVFAELDPKTFSETMKLGKLYIGWQRCRVFEDINLRRCQNCNGYNHSSSKCKNGGTCTYCSGNHKVEECTKTEVKCINCANANLRFKLSCRTDHTADDYEKCSSYTFFRNLKISKINYAF